MRVAQFNFLYYFTYQWRGGLTTGLCLAFFSIPFSTSRGEHHFYTLLNFQPNKVYIGGLPENTRQEDLQNCFGKIGSILNIELK